MLFVRLMCLMLQELVGASGDGFLVILVPLWLRVFCLEHLLLFCSRSLHLPLAESAGLSSHLPSPVGPLPSTLPVASATRTLFISFTAWRQSIITLFTCLVGRTHHEDRDCCCLVFHCLKQPNTEWLSVISLVNE